VVVHLNVESESNPPLSIMTSAIVVAGDKVAINIHPIGKGIGVPKENDPIAVETRAAVGKWFQKALGRPYRPRKNREHSKVEFVGLRMTGAEQVFQQDSATCAIILSFAGPSPVGDQDWQAGVRWVRDFGGEVERDGDVWRSAFCGMDVGVDIAAHQGRLRQKRTPRIEEVLARLEQKIEGELFLLASPRSKLVRKVVGGGKSSIDAASSRCAPEKETSSYRPDVHPMLQPLKLTLLAGNLLGRQGTTEVNSGGGRAEEGKSQDEKQAVSAQHTTPRFRDVGRS
jgi:hypothetical protein